MLKLLSTVRANRNFFPSWRILRRYTSLPSSQLVGGLPTIEIFQRAARNGSETAIISDGKKRTYNDLLHASNWVAKKITTNDLNQERVSFLCPQDFSYVASKYAIWRAGGVAVPLSPSHPAAELEYVIKNSQSTTVIAHSDYETAIRPIAEKANAKFLLLPKEIPTTESSSKSGNSSEQFQLEASRNALIIYTSGTTGKPKGVVHTHANLEAMIRSLVSAWQWQRTDHILEVLPLHHMHGIVNIVLCSLWSGATLEMMPRFKAQDVWARWLREESNPTRLNLFMAVPTIYAKLIEHYKTMSDSEKAKARAACKKFRLMVSGSAALPESVLHAWESISGHRLLERFGMTEIGMALSNPLEGERVPGCVGRPLPFVSVRIVKEDGAEAREGEQGELRVKGPTVFKEYWQRPDATAETFDSEGWFKTGDIAVCQNGIYKILGRASVDILKSGGYKISALDIERELLEHPKIGEVAVVGVADDELGQKIAAIVVLQKGSSSLTVEELKEWAKNRLAPYKIPRLLKILDEMPRNQLGKTNKKELVKLFAPK